MIKRSICFRAWMYFKRLDRRMYAALLNDNQHTGDGDIRISFMPTADHPGCLDGVCFLGHWVVWRPSPSIRRARVLRRGLTFGEALQFINDFHH